MRAEFKTGLAFKIFNFFGAYIAWYGVVYGVVADQPVIAIASMMLFFVVHVVLTTKVSEVIVISSVALIGGVFDSVFAVSGFLSYSAGSGWSAPYWSLLLWGACGTGLNYSMSFLQRRVSLAAAAGALFGPFIYYALMLAGALKFNLPAGSCCLILSVIFAFIAPAMCEMAKRINELNPVYAQ